MSPLHYVSSTLGHHQMVNTKIRLIIFFAAKNGEALYRSKKRLGADCGSDHESIAKFRLQLKKVGKTTRTFRYDLNQFPYYYTVEVGSIPGIYFMSKVRICTSYWVVANGLAIWSEIWKEKHWKIKDKGIWARGMWANMQEGTWSVLYINTNQKVSVNIMKKYSTTK